MPRYVHLAIAALSTTVCAANTVVGYVPDWNPAFTWRNIDYSQVTDLAWAFVTPDSNGNLSVIGPANIAKLDSIVAEAHVSGVKVIASLGGWENGTPGFSGCARSAAARANLGHQVRLLLQERNLDGVDIDWEFPAETDTANLVPFVLELRDSIGPTALLTLAVPASDWDGKWFPLSGAMDAVDWLGVMTYDMTGGWDSHGGYNTPLFPHGDTATWSVSQAMDYWTGTHGFPKSKLLAGTPLYGYEFPRCAGPGSPFTDSAFQISSASIAEALLDSGWTRHWDSVSQVPWASTPSGGYITWNDGRAAGAEGRWLAANGYPGTIVWELTQDWTGVAKHPVMDSLRATLLPDRTGLRAAPVPAIVATSPPRRVDGGWILDQVSGARGLLEIASVDGRILSQVSGSGSLVARVPTGFRGIAILSWRTGDSRGVVRIWQQDRP